MASLPHHRKKNFALKVRAKANSRPSSKGRLHDDTYQRMSSELNEIKKLKLYFFNFIFITGTSSSFLLNFSFAVWPSEKDGTRLEATDLP